MGHYLTLLNFNNGLEHAKLQGIEKLWQMCQVLARLSHPFGCFIGLFPTLSIFFMCLELFSSAFVNWIIDPAEAKAQ